ncbi:MAG: hypothetical protein ACXWF8_13060 [Methylobacter sp.]
MDTSTIHTRPDLLTNSASTQRLKSQENNESGNETIFDNDQDNKTNVGKETVSFSDTSIRLSASSSVKSSDKVDAIETSQQAQQVLNQLINNIQNDPAQAQAAHEKIFDSAVKSLLG